MLGNIGSWVKGTIMKRDLLLVAALVMALTACAGGVPGESPGASAAPSPSSSPTGTPTPSPATATNASCHELAFYLDPVLAAGFTCETVPVSPYELEPYPQHTRVTLQGYPLSGTFFTAHISVYSVADFAIVLPVAFPGRVTDLQALVGGGSAPVFTGPFASPLPFLPQFDAAQAFFAQYGVIPFTNGSGIRFLTEYAQYYAPVNNTDLFYTYQGLTSDGQYWVSAILPINLAGLPADYEAGFGGQTEEQFSNGYESYITAAVGQLDATSPASFAPTIDTLDTLVASIAIAP
jgi:hypothetical protein